MGLRDFLVGERPGDERDLNLEGERGGERGGTAEGAAIGSTWGGGIWFKEAARGGGWPQTLLYEQTLLMVRYVSEWKRHC